MKAVLFLAILFISTTACASTKVDQDLNVYDAHVEKLQLEFEAKPAEPANKEWVKEKLSHMVEVDQYTRYFIDIAYENNYTEEEANYFWEKFGPRWKKVDTENSDGLKELLEIYNWFKISDFGKVADKKAWLLTQHADHDVAFQKSVLKILAELWPLNESEPSNYAYLFDRVAASWQYPSKRVLQRYGTQGMCVGKGKWEPIPIEEPSKVDERRKEVGLPPLQEYIDGFQKICKGNEGQ